MTQGLLTTPTDALPVPAAPCMTAQLEERLWGIHDRGNLAKHACFPQDILCYRPILNTSLFGKTAEVEDVLVAERCGLVTAAVARQLRNANWAANEGFYEAAQTMVALWSDKSIGEVAKTFLIVDEYVGVTSVVQDRIMKVAPAAYDD